MLPEGVRKISQRRILKDGQQFAMLRETERSFRQSLHTCRGVRTAAWAAWEGTCLEKNVGNRTMKRAL